MPGVGDFNLSAFFRAMGIKNPAPSVRESVQPVVNVGNFAGLTPRYQMPTTVWGGDVTAVAGRMSFFQVTPRTPGGCLILFAGSDAVDVLFGIAPRLVGGGPVVPTGTYSVNASVALVESGTDLVVPFAAAVSPQINAAVGTRMTSWPWLVPPGRSAIFTHKAIASAILDWSIMVSDVISGENSTV